jgi:hypothetical protein
MRTDKRVENRQSGGMPTIIAAKKKWVKRVPDLKPGVYADGLPLHQVKYLQCKLILRPNKFVSRKSLFDFAKVIRQPAAAHDVDFSTSDFVNKPLKIREVLFVDTTDFRFYRNAFILRRRIPYHEGFPSGEPEIVLKFRDTDMQKAAETDVRPQILGDYQIKFKCEALPVKEHLGGVRLLFSHNVQFPLSHVHEDNRLSMKTLTRVFPVLEKLKKGKDEKVDLVSKTIVEEVLQDIGIIDFGNGMAAKANVAIWRARGDHRPLVGEFAFQFKFRRREDLREGAIEKAEAFFISLQYEAQDWILLGATKTAVVYGLFGNAETGHE